jgi:hypothetical protein
VIVALIGATRARSGLRAHAELDRDSYPLGVKVADRELAAVPLRRHDWHGEWNYTVLPTWANDLVEPPRGDAPALGGGHGPGLAHWAGGRRVAIM